MCLHGMVKILWNWILFLEKKQFFLKSSKKRPLKWPHFGAFLSWVVLLYAKWGEIKKKAVFVRFRRNLKKTNFKHP